MTEEEAFPEIEAIKTLLKVLGPLKPDERQNVLDFVFKKLGIQHGGLSSSQSRSSVDEFFQRRADAATSIDQAQEARSHSPGSRAPDRASSANQNIRSLKEQKEPRTATEMVALVAYYLEHVAPDSERRNFIETNDIKKYFKQALFKLPSAPPHVTLGHAKNAGYLSSTGARGQFKLTPVGYNLVVHKMPLSRRPRAKE